MLFVIIAVLAVLAGTSSFLLVAACLGLANRDRMIAKLNRDLHTVVEAKTVYIRPHTKTTLSEYGPPPISSAADGVVDSVFVRANAPGNNSKFV